MTDALIERARRLDAIAGRLGLPLAHMALKWVLRDGRVTSALVGARTVAQLDGSLDALSGEDLPQDALAAIEEVLSSRGSR